MTPRFWANYSVRMQPGDIIQVRTDDGRFFAELYVLQASRTDCQVKLMRFVDLEDTKLTSRNIVEQYEWRWMGPAWKHCVIRTADQTMVVKELNSKEDAINWISEKNRNG